MGFFLPSLSWGQQRSKGVRGCCREGHEHIMQDGVLSATEEATANSKIQQGSGADESTSDPEDFPLWAQHLLARTDTVVNRLDKLVSKMTSTESDMAKRPRDMSTREKEVANRESNRARKQDELRTRQGRAQHQELTAARRETQLTDREAVLAIKEQEVAASAISATDSMNRAAQREAEVAKQEGELSSRGQRMTLREEEIADREEELAYRESRMRAREQEMLSKQQTMVEQQDDASAMVNREAHVAAREAVVEHREAVLASSLVMIACILAREMRTVRPRGSSHEVAERKECLNLQHSQGVVQELGLATWRVWLPGLPSRCGLFGSLANKGSRTGRVQLQLAPLNAVVAEEGFKGCVADFLHARGLQPKWVTFEEPPSRQQGSGPVVHTKIVAMYKVAGRLNVDHVMKLARPVLGLRSDVVLCFMIDQNPRSFEMDKTSAHMGSRLKYEKLQQTPGVRSVVDFYVSLTGPLDDLKDHNKACLEAIVALCTGDKCG
eukprot:jgi/Ulvmu1/11518/UM078_0007.1